MGIFDGVLLASDFDGTLKNDRGTIDSEVLEAIEFFQKNGGRFTLSTGRTVQGLVLYDFSFLNAPALLANGSTAYDLNTGELAFVEGIGQEGRDFVRDIVNRFEGISVEMYPFGSTFAINLTDATHRHFSSQGIVFSEVEEPSLVPVPWQKVMVSGERETLLALQDYMKAAYTHPTFLPGGETIVEILAKGVDKGTGLLRLADHLNIPHSQVFAVGDGYNDREMLLAAAEGFVPENGDEKMKALATHVVRSNNEGAVAHVIELLEKKFSCGA